jgi:hypothetical protein
MPKLNKKIAIAAAAVAVVAIGGGTAFAYWSTTGSGSGSATNGSSNGTLVLTATFANGLTPGASEPVSYTATNGGTSNLLVNTIHAVVSTDSALCLASDFTVPDATSGVTGPAGTTTPMTVGASSIAFANTAADQDACKGAVITLTLSTP